jgi:hypothetical protein
LIYLICSVSLACFAAASKAFISWSFSRAFEFILEFQFLHPEFMLKGLSNGHFVEVFMFINDLHLNILEHLEVKLS